MLYFPVLFLSALTVIGAWPVFFYETDKCDHYPVFTLEGPPRPGDCHPFGHVNIRSYSGGTGHTVEKLLLYTYGSTCLRDAAHRAYANYTISNSSYACTSIPQNKIPRHFVFIEELLGPIKTKDLEGEEEKDTGFIWKTPIHLTSEMQ